MSDAGAVRHSSTQRVIDSTRVVLRAAIDAVQREPAPLLDEAPRQRLATQSRLPDPFRPPHPPRSGRYARGAAARSGTAAEIEASVANGVQRAAAMTAYADALTAWAMRRLQYRIPLASNRSSTGLATLA
jgi:hypothetical protein